MRSCGPGGEIRGMEQMRFKVRTPWDDSFELMIAMLIQMGDTPPPPLTASSNVESRGLENSTKMPVAR